jgi:hypothetical protein
MKLVKLTIISAGVLGLVSCSSTPPPVDPHPLKVFPMSRQSSPAYPYYGKTTWVQADRPIPLKTKVKSPYIMPIIEFTLKNSNLAEAIEALSQTIGYEGLCPKSVAKTKVSIVMSGSIENILEEISRQAKVDIKVSYNDRTIQVVDSGMAPTLPSAKSSS